MIQKQLALAPLVLLPFFAAPLHAATDEIRIIQGTLFQVANSRGDLSLRGTSGVMIDATLDGNYAGLAWDYVCPYTTCLPGDVVSLGSSYGSLLGGTGQLTIQGQKFTLWFPDGLSATLNFDGAVVLPEFTDTGTAEVSAPFAFSGSIQVPNQQEPGTFDVVELEGSGVATATLYRNPFTMGWVVGNVRYDFVPRRNVTPR